MNGRARFQVLGAVRYEKTIEQALGTSEWQRQSKFYWNG